MARNSFKKASLADAQDEIDFENGLLECDEFCEIPICHLDLGGIDYYLDDYEDYHPIVGEYVQMCSDIHVDYNPYNED